LTPNFVGGILGAGGIERKICTCVKEWTTTPYAAVGSAKGNPYDKFAVTFIPQRHAVRSAGR